MAVAQRQAGVLWLVLALGPRWSAASSTVASNGFHESGSRIESALSFGQRDEALSLARVETSRLDLSVKQRAQALIYEGEARLQLGDAPGAALLLERALTLAPGDPGTSLLLAQALRDRPTLALAHADRAGRAGATPRRRSVAHRLASEMRFDIGDAAGARLSLERALELGGDELDSLRALAWLERESPGRVGDSLRRARLAAEAAPLWQRGAAYRQCARMEQELKDYPAALASLRRALALDPDDLRALRAMAELKRLPQAQAAFLAEVPRDPERPETPPRNKTELLSALSSDPEDLEALRALAELLRAEGSLAEARAAAGRFTSGIRLAPAWLQLDAWRVAAGLWLGLGDALGALRSRQRAEELGREFLVSFPDLPAEPLKEDVLSATYLSAVQARIELGDRPGVEATLKRGLARLPGNQRLLLGLISALLVQGRAEEALPFAKSLVAAAERESLREVAERQPPILLREKASARANEPRERRLALYLEDPDTAARLRRVQELDLKAAREAMAEVKLALARPKKAPPSAPAPAEEQRDRLSVWIALSLGRPGDALPLNPSDEAEGLLLKGDAAGAVSVLEEALRLEPGAFDEAWLMAQALRDQPQRALSHADQAARVAGTPRRRAAALRLAAELRRQLGDPVGARTNLEGALDADGEDLDVLRALALFWRGEPVRTADYLRRALRAAAAAPLWQRGSAYRRCAMLQRELEDYPGALASLRRALRLDPDDLQALRAMLELKRLRPHDTLFPSERSSVGEDVAAPPAGEKSLERAVAADPENLEALRALSELRRAQGRNIEAKKLAGLFTAAIRRAPEWLRLDALRVSSGLWRSLGDPLLAMASLKRAKQFGSEFLISFPDLRDHPTENLDIYLYSSQARLELGDPAGGEGALKRGLERMPGEPRLLSGLVALMRAQGRSKEALRYVERLSAALERPPLSPSREHAAALKELARLELDLVRPKNALAALSLLVESSSGAEPEERAWALLEMAQVQNRLQRYEEERASLDAALKLMPGYVPALRRRLELAQERPREALELIERLIAATTQAAPIERSESFRRKARVLVELNDEAGARSSWERALELAPEDLESLWRLSSALPPREALALVLRHQPAAGRPQAPWLTLRGLARARLSEDAGAREDFVAAAGLDAKAACYGQSYSLEPQRLAAAHFDACVERFPLDATLWADRGVLRYLSGDKEGAAVDFAKAQELSPDSPEVSLSLATALAALGRPDQALAAAERGLTNASLRKGALYDRLTQLRSELARLKSSK